MPTMRALDRKGAGAARSAGDEGFDLLDQAGAGHLVEDIHGLVVGDQSALGAQAGDPGMACETAVHRSTAP
ncbi:hypothetical protein [Streptomyces turgidiscabies]|uniref:Uncharacterized protein n=1 Tax=Streptomyces turgidiscabies TaxID=85558 RepID=A0ABU0RQP9_9ACTN|nr:hypothetical protein [Streptomyces turgidiscabies]MDQ0934083.1 hypothetical protein [Streptomyces turgidiscabies]